MDRREETKVVKDALAKAGMAVISVKHDRGTAWGWMEVKVAEIQGEHNHERDGWRPLNCPVCQATSAQERRAVEIIQAVTGRNGDYNGQVNISSSRRES